MESMQSWRMLIEFIDRHDLLMPSTVSKGWGSGTDLINIDLAQLLKGEATAARKALLPICRQQSCVGSPHESASSYVPRAVENQQPLR